MRYLLLTVTLVLIQAEIELTRFTPNTLPTAIHQLPNASILTATPDKTIIIYSPKGQLLQQHATSHQAAITAICSFKINASTFIIVADSKGLVTLHDQEGLLQKKVLIEEHIIEMVVSDEPEALVLAIRTLTSLHFYQLPSFELLKTIRQRGGIFRKILFGGQNKAFFAVQQQESTQICSYDLHNSLQEVMMEVNSGILDVSVWNRGDHNFIFIINKKSELEAFQLQGGSVSGYYCSGKEQLLPSVYSSLVYFLNQDNLPLFAAVKDSRQLQFFQGFEVTLFLQMNADIVKVDSPQKERLLLMLSNGQISSLEMKEGDDGVGVYLFAAMLLLLAAALYLCCGDCCPGVIDKWRLRRERQEIELQLYRERTQLDNF